MKNRVVSCAVCGKSFTEIEGLFLKDMDEELQGIILKQNFHLSASSFICFRDLLEFRLHFISDIAQNDTRENEAINKKIIQSIKDGETLSEDVDNAFTSHLSIGQKIADTIAKFGGSWGFILCFMGILALWIIMNSIALFTKPFDPYPFILLNLVLSCLAAIQAPVIMMSQNRQEARDRAQSESDYKINLKSEIEIRLLHEKLDHVLNEQWQHLIEVQRLQIDALNELQKQVENLHFKKMK
ncbi:hypothetical protein PGRAN_10073 [Listeria grandensis FSL F6-0971]|uniref:Cyclic nucleotide-binding protein n=1 Tax=Listeria grandensis FSL F6-0971 TaxID=1265819 RepID=W7B6V1_9LIST|nr:DUF1003 domain-containing protein [Listeria grandensis]EUJ23024.1 hypothetical protein PGRAN_10073 [Listeria grandensis FSL F6-0971]